MKKPGLHELRCSIHRLREDLARRRQPLHNGDLERLLTVVPVDDHPYRGSTSSCYFELLRCPEFRWPSQGPPPRLTADHLYRCVPFDALLSEIEPKPGPKQLPGPANRVLAMKRISKAKRLHPLPGPGPIWVSLAEIAVGTYGRDASPADKPVRRRINWWTDLVLGGDRLIDRLRQVGIPKDWLVPHCALLRCRVTPEILAAGHTPTVLDGFASEIFLPADYAQAPVCGHAIDVGAKPLDRGGNEVVLGPVSVEHIDLRVIRIPMHENQASRADTWEPAFLGELEEYYRSQL